MNWSKGIQGTTKGKGKEKTRMASLALLIPSHMGLCEMLLKSVQVKSIIFP